MIPRVKTLNVKLSPLKNVFNEGFEFKDSLLRDRKIRRYLKQDEIDSFFNIKYYLKYVDRIFKKVGL